MPSGPEIEYNRALEAIKKYKVADALAILDVATTQYPESDPLWAAWIRLLRDLNPDEESQNAVRRYVKLRPDYGFAWLLLAQELNYVGLFEEGAKAARTVIRLDTNPVTLHLAAIELVVAGCAEEAFSVEDRLTREHHEVTGAHLNASNTHEKAGDVDGAWRHCLGAYYVAPSDPDVLRTRAALANYRDDLSPNGHFAIALEYGRLLEQSIAPYPGGFANNRNPDRKLRIGYLSSDFREHAVAEFTLGFMEAMDRDEFELTLYYLYAGEDAVTQKYREVATRFRHLPDVAPKVVMDQVRADKIDILVDLMGHTSGGISGAMAIRPAPVQVTQIGFPGSTGLTRIQYRVVDSLTDPPGSESLSSEQIARLDPCFLCYQPHRGWPTRRVVDFDRPSTFGCFGNLMKMSTTTARLWASALNATPEAKLVLNTRALRNTSSQEMIRKKLAEGGVPLDRVQMRPGSVDYEGFAQAYAEIDVALDTYPYHGTTTTCEATSWGVPTVTLAGDTHRSRVGVSLLTNLGHPEWIAHSEEEFGQIAGGLIRDRAKLASLRTSLPEELKRSPICDVEAYVERLGEFYREAWRSWCENPV